MKKILTVHAIPEIFKERFNEGFEEYELVHIEEDLSHASSVTEILEEVRIHSPEFVLVGIPTISPEVKKNLKILRNKLYRKRVPTAFILPEHLTLEEIVMFSHETGIDSLIDEEYTGKELLISSLLYKEIFEQDMAEPDMGLKP